jgi:hypothetical protein
MKLLNVSNHDPKTWSPKQKQGWDKILHIPFPEVDPSWDFEKLKKVAQDLTDKICQVTGASYGPSCDCGWSHGIHDGKARRDGWRLCLQGESSLCALLQMQMGVTYWQVFPCSARNTVENADGSKTVRFEFVQWRGLDFGVGK